MLPEPVSNANVPPYEGVPVLLHKVLVPALITTSPLELGLETFPDPLDSLILPAWPFAALPELILIRPVVPELDVPVLKSRAPLIPETPEFAEATKIEPEDDFIDSPLIKYNEAPVAYVLLPLSQI
tara:strand:- start:4 stop:381 length:378 start_codon:yes stop_codon:yes gene_type:complete